MKSANFRKFEWLDILTSPVVVCSVLAIGIVSNYWQSLLYGPLCPFVAVAFFYMGTALWALGGYLMKPDYLFPEVPVSLAPHSRFIRARSDLRLQQLAMFGALLGLSGGLWISALGFQTMGKSSLALVAEYPLDGAVAFFLWALYLVYTVPGDHKRLALSSPSLWDPVSDTDREALRRQSIAYTEGLRNRPDIDPHSIGLIVAALTRRDAAILHLVDARPSPVSRQLREFPVDRIFMLSMKYTLFPLTIAVWLMPIALGCTLVYLLVHRVLAHLDRPAAVPAVSLAFGLTLAAFAVFLFGWGWFTRPSFMRRKRPPA